MTHLSVQVESQHIIGSYFNSTPNLETTGWCCPVKKRNNLHVYGLKVERYRTVLFLSPKNNNKKAAST